jgi:glycosyltransferase involved in cell wall biosynthesis
VSTPVPEGAPLVSVVVCTHERSDDLGRCIAAAAQQVRAQGWELLVIDSASSAQHARALRDHAAAHGVACDRLDEAGLSRARNRGAALARGRWIAYLDDDAIVRPDWAARLADALQTLPEQVALLGGRIDPRWPADRPAPRDITSRWLLLLSCVRRAGSGRVDAGWDVCGANLVVRKSALAAIGGFPEGLGRVGQRLIGGEESYVIRRLQHDGLEARYDGRFGVEHNIEAERLGRAWLRRRAYWEGVTRVAIHRALGEAPPRSLWRPKLLASIPVLWLLARLRPSNPDWDIRLAQARGSAWALDPRAGLGAQPRLQEARP